MQMDAAACALAYYDAAEAAELAGDPRAALSAYQHSLHLDPADAVCATNLAVCAKHLGATAGACAALLLAQGVDPSRRLTHVQRLLDGGTTFGGRDACSEEAAAEAARFLRETLRAGEYSAGAARRLVGATRDTPTGTDYFCLRMQSGLRGELVAPNWPQPQGALFLLFLLGAALRRDAACEALGAACVSRMLALGLLVEPPPAGSQLVASPVQVYPLSLEVDDDRGGSCDDRGGSCDDRGGACDDRGGACELLLVTDWDVESLLPTKFAVMPIGADSLDLVHLAPRDACECVLDLCRKVNLLVNGFGDHIEVVFPRVILKGFNACEECVLAVKFCYKFAVAVCLKIYSYHGYLHLIVSLCSRSYMASCCLSVPI